MLLSTKLFDRIVGVHASPTHSDPHRRATVLPVGCRRAERRSITRLPFGHRSQLCPDSGKQAGVWITVMLQDISQQGIGYLGEHAMDIGQTFVLKLLDRQGETIRIRCRVSRCERGGFGNTAYTIGATFEQVIEQQQIRINEDPGDHPRWQEAPAHDPGAQAVGCDPTTEKTAGSAMARVAAQLLRVVTPSRMVSHWMHRSDDFS